jgi:hypothetical protein
MQYPCLVGKVTPGTYSSTSVSPNLTWVSVSPTFTGGPSFQIASGQAGLYRLCGQLYIQIAGTGSANWSLNWQVTSADGHQFGYATGNAVNTSQWSQANGCVSFYTDGVGSPSNIQLQVYTGGGATVAPTIRYGATLEKLQ